MPCRCSIKFLKDAKTKKRLYKLPYINEQTFNLVMILGIVELTHKTEVFL